MSALAKPLVNFTAATNPNTFVPVEQVMDVETVSLPATSSAGPVTATYKLRFTVFDPNNTLGGRIIDINFAASADMTTALADFLTLASAPL